VKLLGKSPYFAAPYLFDEQVGDNFLASMT